MTDCYALDYSLCQALSSSEARSRPQSHLPVTYRVQAYAPSILVLPLLIVQHDPVQGIDVTKKDHASQTPEGAEEGAIARYLPPDLGSPGPTRTGTVA